MLLNQLIEKNLIAPPPFLATNTIYLTAIGSTAYGCADTNTNSDLDVYGICIPPKEDVFPFRRNIYGFDEVQVFNQFHQHHINDTEKDQEYDITIYSIVKFFKLLMENNPSCIDTLFTPQECVLHITKAGNILRENRKLFLHKGCFHKYKGYAYSMLHKMRGKKPEEGSKRFELRNKYGFDVKYALHVVRLLDAAEQILATGDLDLRKNKEQLKAIRRGEVPVDEIVTWASKKEAQLEELYHTSSLPWGPDKDAVRDMLTTCLEIQYGSIKEDYISQDLHTKSLKAIKEIIGKIDI